MFKKTFSKTKIVATIGPASSSKEMMEKIIDAGADVLRINASHGEHAVMQQIVENIRLINEENDSHIAILFDLQGPKIRIGEIENGSCELNDGAQFILTTKLCIGNAEMAYIKYSSFINDVKKGDLILIDDGKIQLQVENILNDTEVTTKVIYGGVLSSRKGVNLPNTKISLPSLTEKDHADLTFALNNNIEWIGLSFVRSARDILFLKEIIKKHGKQTKVIAKIEKPEAVDNIDAIINATDGVMVARGDLGVEVEMERVPIIQKQIVSKCREASKPVIIATQMMESMVSNFRPTRAEANDVGNAVYDGADALMLSGETSVGKFPVETVKAMQKIILAVEADESIYYRFWKPNGKSKTFISDSTCYNACVIAMQSGAVAIAAMTHSGYTAYKISSQRPKANTFIFTDNKPILNTLSLFWGVRGLYYDKYESTDQTITDIKNILKENGYVHTHEIIIHVASTPLNERSRANTIKINKVDD